MFYLLGCFVVFRLRENNIFYYYSRGDGGGSDDVDGITKKTKNNIIIITIKIKYKQFDKVKFDDR